MSNSLPPSSCRLGYPPLRGGGCQVTDKLRDNVSKVLAVADYINEAVRQEKFRGLKAFRKFLADGLFYDPGACKTNKRLWLRYYDVAQRGKARKHPCHGGIGEY